MTRGRFPGAAVAAALALLGLAALPRLSEPGAAFLVPRRSRIAADLANRHKRGGEATAPCRHRASAFDCEEDAVWAPKAPAPPQAPEVNYFTSAAAAECVQEGCPKEEAEDIYDRLAREEARVQESLRALENPGLAPSSAADIERLQNFLVESRGLRRELWPVLASRHSNFSQEFIASLAFGDKMAGLTRA